MIYVNKLNLVIITFTDAKIKVYDMIKNKFTHSIQAASEVLWMNGITFMPNLSCLVVYVKPNQINMYKFSKNYFKLLRRIRVQDGVWCGSIK